MYFHSKTETYVTVLLERSSSSPTFWLRLWNTLLLDLRQPDLSYII